MHENKVHVIATFVAAAGKENELRTLMEALVEPSRKEAGCLRYDLLQGIRNSGNFVFIEEWESEEALAAHSQSAHIMAAGKKVDPLLGSPANITRYRQVR